MKLRQSSLVQYVQVSPQRLFWVFAGAHLLLWTLLPALLYQNAPLDVIEGLAWGKEWLIGTHKHPPMQAWILEIFYCLTGRNKWAPYLVCQLAIITAFWAVWQTGRRIAGDKQALIGALLLEGIVYYNFTSTEFNPNILQICFWALSGWSFHKAVTENKGLDWVLLGLWAAGGMYSKYSTGLFLLVLMAAMFAHRDGRKRLVNYGPYLSVMIALLLFTPHLLWLKDHDFLPLSYTLGRLGHHQDHYSTALTTTLLVTGQCIALIFWGLLLIILYDRHQGPSRPPMASFDRIFLTLATFGPFATTFSMSLFLGYHIRDMWQAPFWNFLGLWAVVMLRPSLKTHDVLRFAVAWGFTFVIGLLVFTLNETLAPYVSMKPHRTLFPGKNVSQTILDIWHVRFHKPLQYVIGDTWPAGNIAWYADDRPHVFIDGDTQISTWIDRSAVDRDGGIIVWCIKCDNRLLPDENMPAHLHDAFPDSQLQPPLVINRITQAHVPPVVIGWAIVIPKS